MPPVLSKSLSAKGVSASWTGQQRNVVRIFDLFAEQDEELSTLDDKFWQSLPEATLCSADVYERFAFFMLHIYEPDARKADERLDGSTARNYLAIAIHLACDKFKAIGSDTTKRFFDCLDTNSTSEHAKWLRGLKANIEREHFARTNAAGKKLDKSESARSLSSNAAVPSRFECACLLSRAGLSLCSAPIYLKAIKAINRAYAKAGTKEAATRRFGIASGWGAAGRSSEAACLTWDTGLEWDDEMEGVFAEIHQSKTAKAKLIAYVAGADRFCCWFLALGDFMAFNPPPIYNSDEPSWMIPELHGTSSPGTKLGDWLKALRLPSRGGAAGYAEFAKEIKPPLHDNINAGGIRPGCSNFLSKYMPAEFVAHVTGHDYKGTSALFEYVDADRALALIGALVLAGWPPLPYGHHGDGPSPPSLNALREAKVDVEALDQEFGVIDQLFNLDDASPPSLLTDGALRPMVHAAFASMLMYHDQRMAAGEMRPVCIKLIEILGTINVSAIQVSDWGAKILEKFEQDNVHLTMGKASVDGPAAQVIKSLNRSMSAMKIEITGLRRDLAADGAPRTLAPPNTPRATPANPSTTRAADSPMADASPIGEAAAAGPSGMGSLIPPVQGAAEPKPAPMELKDAVAGDYYANCMARGGSVAGLVKQDKARVELLLSWFNAMGTEDEKLLLKPAKAGHAIPSEGERRRTAARLQKLVVARLSEGFGKAVPRELGKGQLSTTALENRVRALKALSPSVVIVPTSASFALWRQAHEAKAVQADSEASSKRARTEDGP